MWLIDTFFNRKIEGESSIDSLLDYVAKLEDKLSFNQAGTILFVDANIDVSEHTIEVDDLLVNSLTLNDMGVSITSIGAGLEVDDTDLQVKLGSGLEYDGSDGLQVKENDGIEVDSNGVAVKAKTNGGIEVASQGVAVKIAQDEGLNLSSAGLKCTYPYKRVSFEVTATTDGNATKFTIPQQYHDSFRFGAVISIQLDEDNNAYIMLCGDENYGIEIDSVDNRTLNAFNLGGGVGEIFFDGDFTPQTANIAIVYPTLAPRGTFVY